MCKRKWMAAVSGLALVALTLPALPQTAEAPQLYNVEIVVFRTRAPLGVAEDWNVQSATVDTTDDDAADAPAPAGAAARTAIHPLSSAQFKLAGTDAALRRSSNYQVLAHAAWTQAAAPRGLPGTPLADLGIGDSTLRGTVALEQGRYLHLNFDLAWTPADPPSSLLGTSNGTAPVTFTLRQKRRVKPFEQHYFDHPAFGVIAIISPAN